MKPFRTDDERTLYAKLWDAVSKYFHHVAGCARCISVRSPCPDLVLIDAEAEAATKALDVFKSNQTRSNADA